MSGRFILDTNIVIAIFSGETSIKEHLLKADESQLPARISHIQLPDINDQFLYLRQDESALIHPSAPFCGFQPHP